MAEAIKSRPVYESIAIDSHIQNHIFISEDYLIDALLELSKQCDCSAKSFWILTQNPDLAFLPDGTVVIDKLDFKRLVSDKLKNLPISSTLYVAGISESFLWDIHQLAVSVGLAAEQIKKLPPLTNQRRLFCTHCYTVTEGVKETPCQCPGCNRHLLVRDHFSKIHGAYVGVQINAEDPQEIFKTEEVA